MWKFNLVCPVWLANACVTCNRRQTACSWSGGASHCSMILLSPRFVIYSRVCGRKLSCTFQKGQSLDKVWGGVLQSQRKRTIDLGVRYVAFIGAWGQCCLHMSSPKRLAGNDGTPSRSMILAVWDPPGWLNHLIQ